MPPPLSIQIKPALLHFRRPFQIAYERVETAEVVIVCIRDAQGNEGLGCAAPDQEVTGETVQDALTALRERLTPELFTEPLENHSHYHTVLAETFAGLPAAQSAAEDAVLRLSCAQAGKPFASLFGRARESCPATVTLGISDLDGTLSEVKERLAEGFQILKLKCGLDVKSDCARISAVRNVAPQSTLLLDANQGYSYAEAECLLQSASGWNIAGVEQPLAAQDTEGMRRLQRGTPIPIIADESALSLGDVRKLLMGNDALGGVNVKLMKCGGPLNAAEIIREAKRLKKIVMLGCMYESNASITTALELALTLPVDYADLDSGHFDFDDDPVAGGAALRNGSLWLAGPLALR